jgi:hypothetical protein
MAPASGSGLPEAVPGPLECLPTVILRNPALSRGERVTRSGAFTSRSVTGGVTCSAQHQGKGPGPLPRGEAWHASGAFTSRSVTGEGSLARINRASQKSKRKRQIAKVAIAGSGVICETSALHAVVIPAKAGIHSANLRECHFLGLDSRLRRNDRWFVRQVIPNDATTRSRVPLTFDICDLPFDLSFRFADPCLQPPVAQRGRCRVLSCGLAVPRGQGETIFEFRVSVFGFRFSASGQSKIDYRQSTILTAGTRSHPSSQSSPVAPR